MKGVGIIPNWHKENAYEVVEKVRSFFEGAGLTVNILKKELKERPVSLVDVMEDWPGGTDMIIVVGGDGTILRVARDLAYRGLPILGINVGHKGFLAEMEVHDLPEYLEHIITGNYAVSERIMLESSVIRDGKKVAEFTALNDMVVTKGPFSRIIRLDAFISGEFLERYTGDGLIISTPTGSTGYSLSAGGPIVNPLLDVLVVTPVCPHSLYNRSVIVDGRETIGMHVYPRQSEVLLTVDGQVGFALHEEDRVIVSRSPLKVSLVTFRDRSFYNILGRKLKE